MQIIIEPLEKAVLTLQDSLNQPLSVYTRDSVIQRYEYTYELSWKMIERFLLEIFNIREKTFGGKLKEALRNGLVDNIESWVVFREVRNYTSHSYNEQVAIWTYGKAAEFLPIAQKLILVLQSLNKTYADQQSITN